MANPNSTLTDQDIAAIEAGATMSAGTVDEAAVTAAQALAAQAVIDAAAAASADAASAAAAAEATATATAAAEAQAAADAATAAAAAATAVAAAAAAATSQVDVVAFLQGQVKEKDAELLKSGISTKALETKVAGMEASHAGLLEIARASVSTMQVALGGSALDLSGSDALVVLAEHARVQALFTDKIKVGGVAAVAPGVKDVPAPAEKQAVATPLRDAQVAATRRLVSK